MAGPSPIRAAPGSSGGSATQPVEFVPLARGSSPSTSLQGVALDTVYSASESGGQQAPEKKVETGYTWSTRVGAEPISVTLKAWMNADQYANLAQLRDERAPLSLVMAGQSLEVALTNLSPSVSGESPGAYDVTIEVREVQQASLSTSGLRTTPVSGPQSSAGGGTPPSLGSSAPVREG